MTSLNNAGYVNPRNPIAQSFYVEEEEGIFLTQIDCFFESTASNAPVSLHLRPVINGFPSISHIIPGSVVYVNGNNVNTSVDATVATEFVFNEPIYLRGGYDYAFCVTTPHPDFKIYIAQIDEFEINTTARRVVRNPALGSLYYSHNGNTFTPAQEQDLKFKLHRAQFDISAQAQIVLQNAAVPKRLLADNPVFTDSASSTVFVDCFNSGLLFGDKVTVAGVDSSSTIGGIPGDSINGTHTITKVDWSGFEFSVSTTATGNATGGGTAVTTTPNLPYVSVYDNTTSLLPVNTFMSSGLKRTTHKSFAGSETAYQREASFVGTPIGLTTPFDKAFVTANIENETTHTSGLKSLSQQIDLSSVRDNVSPIIDLQRSSITLIDNVIDKQDSAATNGFNVPTEFVSELSPFGGSSASKHITRVVNLEEDAVGLKILFAAYRPFASDFEVYYKTCTQDVDITTVAYRQVEEETNNPTDDVHIFRDYRYLAGGEGGDLAAFNRFQVKIVFRSTNRANVPHIRDLRVIALSV